MGNRAPVGGWLAPRRLRRAQPALTDGRRAGADRGNAGTAAARERPRRLDEQQRARRCALPSSSAAPARQNADRRVEYAAAYTGLTARGTCLSPGCPSTEGPWRRRCGTTLGLVQTCHWAGEQAGIAPLHGRPESVACRREVAQYLPAPLENRYEVRWHVRGPRLTQLPPRGRLPGDPHPSRLVIDPGRRKEDKDALDARPKEVKARLRPAGVEVFGCRQGDWHGQSVPDGRPTP